MVARSLMLACLLAIAACTTTKGSFCEIAKPVRLGSAAIDALSDAEVKAILAHNQKGARLCGWRK